MFFFIATDGLHDYVSDKEILKVLKSGTEDLTVLCGQLVARSLVKGSVDNISCQVLKITELPSQNLDEAYFKTDSSAVPA